MMNTLITDKKYTVMLSAYQSTNTHLQNLMDSEMLAYYIEHDWHCHAIRAVGVYNGAAEQSFVVHTNSSNVMGELKRFALGLMNQECVLVSNNRKHDIQLHNSDATTTHIGHAFRCYTGVPKGCKNYTVLRGCDYWVVN